MTLYLKKKGKGRWWGKAINAESSKTIGCMEKNSQKQRLWKKKIDIQKKK